MHSIKQYTGTLTVIERLESSLWGNPRYRVQVGAKKAKTVVDGSLAYGITNYAGKEVVALIGTHYGTAHIHDVELAAEVAR